MNIGLYNDESHAWIRKRITETTYKLLSGALKKEADNAGPGQAKRSPRLKKVHRVRKKPTSTWNVNQLWVGI